MNKIILSTTAVIGLVLSVFAQQNPQNTFDPQNAREGEDVEYCRQHTKHAALLNNPAYLQSLLDDEVIRMQEAANPQPENTETYYIPVVFHLLHNNGNEFISDEQILDAFENFESRLHAFELRCQQCGTGVQCK